MLFLHFPVLWHAFCDFLLRHAVCATKVYCVQFKMNSALWTELCSPGVHVDTLTLQCDYTEE